MRSPLAGRTGKAGGADGTAVGSRQPPTSVSLTAEETFDGRFAAELRLWDAIDDGTLCPFQYFGVHDDVDLTGVRWARGHYDLSELENVYTGNDMRLAKVLKGPRYKKQDYLDTIFLVSKLMKMLRTEGPIALEPHVEDPKSSAVFADYPRLLADHTLVNLIAVILLLLWIYYKAFVFLLGGEVAETYDLMRMRRFLPGMIRSRAFIFVDEGRLAERQYFKH